MNGSPMKLVVVDAGGRMGQSLIRAIRRDKGRYPASRPLDVTVLPSSASIQGNWRATQGLLLLADLPEKVIAEAPLASMTAPTGLLLKSIESRNWQHDGYRHICD